MEKSTPLGLVAGLVLILATVSSDGDWQLFFDLRSFLIVFGGTAVTLLLSFTFTELRLIFGTFKNFLNNRRPNLEAHLFEFSEYSRIAYRDGLLALDNHLAEKKDESLAKFGLELAIDGIDEAHVSEMMHVRIAEQTKGLRLLAKFFSNAGTYAPAFGLIGTLMGLIQMLHNMNTPAIIGPAMSVAIITTFYGAILANLIFLPLATKVKTQVSTLQQEGEMIRTGVLAVLRGESPSMVERRIAGFVENAPPMPTPIRESELHLAHAA